MSAPQHIIAGFALNAPFEIVKCRGQRAWLKQRVTGIGASESPALYGVSPFESLYSLWVRKFGKNAISIEESEAMEWGKRLEDPIARAYRQKTGRPLIDLGRTTILRSKTDPWMFATLDRVIDGIDRRWRGVLEIKATGAFHREEWEAEELPLRVQVQVQHQLAVTGYQWASIAVLVGGNRFAWRDVERNEAFIADLRARCAAFGRLVETGVPPEIDGSEHTALAIATLYSKHDGPAVELPRDIEQDDAQLGAVKREISALEAQEKLLTNRIRAAIGDAAAGVLPSGARWVITSSPRAGYTVAPTTVTTMRRLNAPKPKKLRRGELR